MRHLSVGSIKLIRFKHTRTLTGHEPGRLSEERAFSHSSCIQVGALHTVFYLLPAASALKRKPQPLYTKTSVKNGHLPADPGLWASDG